MSFALVLLASLQLALWVFVRRDGAFRVIIPTDAPYWLDRAVMAGVAIVAVIAAVGAAVTMMRVPTGDPRRDRPRRAHGARCVVLRRGRVAGDDGDEHGDHAGHGSDARDHRGGGDDHRATDERHGGADGADRAGDARPAPGYPPQPTGVPFPETEWPEAELPADVDAAAITAAVDAAFGEPDAPQRVRSVVVVHGGQVVYERYHPLDGPDVVYDSYSVAKSFTSALIGMLADDGALALDEPAPVPEWQSPGDPRQAITVRQMLEMSSGLEWTEEYGPGSLFQRMVTSDDAAAVMAAQPLESAPGSTFEYSTGTSTLLVGAAADELGGCAAATEYLEERLVDPIGITSEHLLTDGGGCWFGGLGADMTTRDFARFGLLYLRGGQWDGRQLVPTSWIDETRDPRRPTPSTACTGGSCDPARSPPRACSVSASSSRRTPTS